MEKMTFRQIRLAKEISQESMAKQLGVHVNTYSEWEKDPTKITLINATRICNVLGVNPDFVIFLPDNPTNMLEKEVV